MSNNKMAIHQLLPVFSPETAIGNAVKLTRDILHDLGYESEIFAEIIDSRLAKIARPHQELRDKIKTDDAVMYHLSIGSPLANVFSQLPTKKIVIYHNITPAEYYTEASPRVTYWIRRGRDDLKALGPIADLWLCASNYNADEAISAGAQKVITIPPPIDLERLTPKTSSNHDPSTILFVGRLAPNKRQDELITILTVLRATEVPNAQLLLIGGSEDTGPYARALRKFAHELNVNAEVQIPLERVDDNKLREYYSRSTVFACVSEHEGFGVPLIEAMAFGVPVIAYNSTAVTETVGNAGIIVDNKDPLVWASLIARLIKDQSLRQELIRRGYKRIGEFNRETITNMYRTALLTL